MTESTCWKKVAVGHWNFTIVSFGLFIRTFNWSEFGNAVRIKQKEIYVSSIKITGNCTKFLQKQNPVFGEVIDECGEIQQNVKFRILPLNFKITKHEEYKPRIFWFRNTTVSRTGAGYLYFDRS